MSLSSLCVALFSCVSFCVSLSFCMSNLYQHNIAGGVIYKTKVLVPRHEEYGTWYIHGSKICANYVHTQTAILNILLLTWFTASPHSQCQLEAISSWRIVFWIPKNGCQHRFYQRKQLPLQTKFAMYVHVSKCFNANIYSTKICNMNTFFPIYSTPHHAGY